MFEKELQQTISDMVIPGKGILAADESNPTAEKRLASINMKNTEEARRQYRNMILTRPGIEKYISGVILFEETLHQKTDSGMLFPKYLQQLGIVPGIKVDMGLKELDGTEEKVTTHGLEGLGDRLDEYKKSGARFTKWRTVFQISDYTPSDAVIQRNAEDLTKYASISHKHGFVPIVEPEILIDGDHSIERAAEVGELAMARLYDVLKENGVELKYTILKPSMVISGKDGTDRAGVQEVAKQTVEILKKTVPEEVPSINFLSGGQGPQEATAHLNAINALGEKFPWYVSFSYARALQELPLAVWQGKQENLDAAQTAFIERAELNGLATQGKSTERWPE
jgi:fructose-bisphosphate aldolase class I